jgi:hypothetical protein
VSREQKEVMRWSQDTKGIQLHQVQLAKCMHYPKTLSMHQHCGAQYAVAAYAATAHLFLRLRAVLKEGRSVRVRAPLLLAPPSCKA